MIGKRLFIVALVFACCVSGKTSAQTSPKRIIWLEPETLLPQPGYRINTWVGQVKYSGKGNAWMFAPVEGLEWHFDASQEAAGDYTFWIKCHGYGNQHTILLDDQQIGKFTEKKGNAYLWNRACKLTLTPGKHRLFITGKGLLDVFLLVDDPAFEPKALEGRALARNDLVKKLPVSDKAAYIHDKSTFHVSPDLVTRVYFRGQTNIKDLATHTFKFHLLLPEGVTPADKNRGLGAFKASPAEKDGVKLTEYVFDVPKFIASHETHVYLNTTWKYGQTGNAYYYITWDGANKPSARKLELTAVDVPRVTGPSKMLAGLFLSPSRYQGYWDDYVAELKALGINTLIIFGGLSFTEGISPNMIKFLDDCKKAGMRPAANYSPFCYGYGSLVKKDQAAHGKTVDGKYRWCPNYRGELFDKYALDYVRKIARYGVTCFEFDTEISSVCYCDRCKAKFKTFLAEEHPNLPYRDPQEFMKSVSDWNQDGMKHWSNVDVWMKETKKNPEYYKAWHEFTAETKSEWFGLFRQQATKTLAEKGIDQSEITFIPVIGPGWRRVTMGGQFSPWEIVVHDNLNPKTLKNHTEVIGTMLYIDSVHIQATVGKVMDAWNGMLGGPGKIANLVHTGEPFCSHPQALAVKYGAYESAIYGQTGVMFWHHLGCDAAIYRSMALALQAMAPVEDIILEGKADPNVTAEKPFRVRAIRKGSQTVVYVTEYSGKSKKGRITVPVAGKLNVYDLETREKVGWVSEKKNFFDATLGKENARLYVIGMDF